MLSVTGLTTPGLVQETSFRYLLVLAYMLAFALARPDDAAGGDRVRDARDRRARLRADLLRRLRVCGRRLQPARPRQGAQGDYNFFALYEVVALPPALVLAARAGRPAVLVLYYGVVAAIVLSVVASLSRSGLLALASVVS